MRTWTKQVLQEQYDSYLIHEELWIWCMEILNATTYNGRRVDATWPYTRLPRAYHSTLRSRYDEAEMKAAKNETKQAVHVQQRSR